MTRESARRSMPLLMALFLVSGAAALTYQVLWVRELGLIVGSTAQAAALAIAIFFTGIAAGGWFWGRRAGGTSSALGVFGRLEVGVAVTALGHLVLLDLIAALPDTLHPLAGAPPTVDLLTKIAVATVVLLPPAFLMGGTLPMMAEHVVRAGGGLGERATLLYSVNTAGAALGVVAAGFLLPPVLGYGATYLLAVGMDLAVGITAIFLARTHKEHSAKLSTQTIPAVADTSGQQAFSPSHQEVFSPARPATTPAAANLGPPNLGPPIVWSVALVSGIATLSVEVLWTRLFSQVLQNSVQTYALVLATFLAALSLGALLASRLCRVQRVSPEFILTALLLSSGAAVAVSGPLFLWVTEGVRTIGAGLGWGAYLATVTGATLSVMLGPGIIIGTVLPYLLKLLERDTRSPGELVGRLVAVNTVGAIGGALTAGFVLLPLLGTARALLVTAAAYPVLAALVLLARGAPAADTAVGLRRRAPAKAATAFVAVALAVGLLALPVRQLNPAATLRPDESLVALRDGPAATVTVVEQGNGLSLRVNRTYILGGTRTIDSERDQIALPLLIHPDPKSVFTLGMGTGITAGAALAFPIDELVVCELLDDVVSLSREHFEPWIGGLFTDDRATVVADDGRSCLQRSNRRYDVAVSDLFIPWQAGTGSLYTRQLYEAARSRLNPGGLFVQWLPLYQIGREEFDVVAATMDAVFDEVVLLRGDLFPSHSIVALVGSVDGPVVLDPDVIARNAAAVDVGPRKDAETYVSMVARMYAGNVTHSGLFAAAEVDTDAQALVELRAPRTHRRVAAGQTTFVTGAAREQLYEDLATLLPPQDDPALQLFNDDALGHVTAGQLLSHAAWLRGRGDEAAAAQLNEDARHLLPPNTLNFTSPSRVLLAPPRVQGRTR